MTRSLQYFGILLGIIAIIGIASAGVSVQIKEIKPSGDLISGQTQVSADFVVLFSSSGGYTFDNDHVLVMDTELDSPTWIYSLTMDGIENPPKTVTGPNIRLSGWELSYPSDHEISLKVKMRGTAPLVETSASKTIIRVREVDGKNSVIPGTEIVRNKIVLNPASVSQGVNAQVSTLTDLKARIGSLAAKGVDVGILQARAGQAEAYLQSAELTSDSVKAQNDLTAAGRLIDDLKISVSALEAQKAISEAQASIDQTEDLIGYFKENRNMGSDARLVPIIANWDIASGKLTAAKDLNSVGKYEEAVQKANEALVQGNQALAQARSLKDTIDHSTSVTQTVAGTVKPTQTQPASHTPQVTTTATRSSVEAQQQEIIDKLNRQNELLEEQNRKLSEQNSLLQNFIDAWNSFLRSIGLGT